MKGTKASKDKKNQADGPAVGRDETQTRSDPAGPQADILALQLAAGNQATGALLNSDLPNEVRNVLKAPGQPLDSETRAEMESRFGQEFSDVVIHADEPAQESARAVQARAYTVGEDIAFGEGRYQPQTGEGKRLLAHELAHVVQQRRGGPTPALRADAPHEQDAGRASNAVQAGQPSVSVAASTAPGLARDADPEVDEMLDEALKEGPTDKPIKSSKPGQPANVGPQKALSPQELLDDHVFGSHVEEEVGDLRKRLKTQEDKLAQMPKDAKLQKQVEAMRQQLRVLEGKGVDPKQTGTNVPGHGRINTRAAVQLVGPDGKVIAVERGRWHPDRHAEEDALQKLRKRLGDRKLPPGTRMDVAGNQYVCPDVCKPAVKKFADDYGIDARKIDATVRTRPKVTGAGEASPKTTERTGLRRDVPNGQVKTEQLFPGQGAKAAPTTPPPTVKQTPPTAQQPPASTPKSKVATPNQPTPTRPPGTTPPTVQQAPVSTPKSNVAPQNAPAPTPVAPAPKPNVAPKVDPTKTPKLTGRLRLPSRSTMRGIGRGAAAAIASLILQYFIGQWMAKIEQDLVNDQIKKMQPEIEAKVQEALTAQSEELVKLRQANPNAEIYLNLTFELHRMNVATPQGIQEALPVVEIGKVGYSLQPWGPTPSRIDIVGCGTQTVNVETLAVSDKVPIKELFEE